uniref:Uncharacterized protein n=1 Tax=Panagrolaimus sp. ES5 TaxID=591445 RepID=A0AC34FDB0_9BILA
MQKFNPRIISRSNVYIQRFLSSEKMVPNSWDPLMYEEAVKKYNNIKGKLDSKTRSKLDGILNQAHYDDNSDKNAKDAMSKNKDHSKTAKVEEAQKQFATMVMELDAK